MRASAESLLEGCPGRKPLHSFCKHELDFFFKHKHMCLYSGNKGDMSGCGAWIIHRCPAVGAKRSVRLSARIYVSVEIRSDVLDILKMSRIDS